MRVGHRGNADMEAGEITVGHLLMAIGFFMPVEAVVIVVKHAGGGALRYALGVPLGLALGVLIVRLDWKIGKALWLRSRNYSEKVQNGVALGVFALQVVWIIAGAIVGDELASLLVRYVAWR